MPKVSVYNSKGEVVAEQKLDEALFAVEANPILVQQVVVAEQANARQSLAHTKTRGEVRGGGKKPWRQKGTGRARHGSIRSPLWRGGGVTFGPRSEENHTKKINKRMKRKALLMALTDKVQNNQFIVLDKLEVSGKTKDWDRATSKILSSVKPEAKYPPKTLVMVPVVSAELKKTTGNLPGVEAIRTDSLSLRNVIGYEYTMITVEGVKELESWLGKNKVK